MSLHVEPNEATFGAAISACEGAQVELSTQTEKLRRWQLVWVDIFWSIMSAL